MNDMSATIVAKSDQINAADLVGITKTITIRDVKIKPGEDQPVSIYFDGDQKAFRPCKGVRRLMVRVWGPDASKYVGQSMTLFQDPTVTWAGKPEGGIRVSAMTGLKEAIVEPMRISRAATKPYRIEPLDMASPQNRQRQTAEEWVQGHIAAAQNAETLDALSDLIGKGAKAMAKLETDKPELWAEVNQAYAARRAQIEGEGKPTEEQGEGFTEDWEN